LGIQMQPSADASKQVGTALRKVASDIGRHQNPSN